MRSAPHPSVVDDDLTTKARIRDAAVEHIARVGFRDATVRAIATAAGVSAALVVHHYGSKEGLRRACDGYVLGEFHAYVQRNSGRTSVAQIVSLMSSDPDTAELAVLTAYAVRAMIDGGELAQQLFNGVVQDTLTTMREGVAAGLFRPAQDELGRARMLAATSLGAAMMTRYISPDEPDPVVAQRELREQLTGPGLELYTYGLFTDDSLLRAYLAERRTPGSETPVNDVGPPAPIPAASTSPTSKKARKSP